MPRKTLVLSSGGILGVVYGGAFRCMEERGVTLSEFESVYGTSVGGLVGLLVVLGMNYRSIRSLLISLPMDSLLHITSNSILRIADTCGLDSGRQLRKLTRSILYRILRREKPTLGELYQLTGKMFTVNAVDIRTGQVVYFGTNRTPEILVEDAICSTAAIPFMYAPVRIHDMVLVDGGVAEALMITQVPKEDIPTTIALVPTPKMEGTIIETVMDVMRCSYTTLTSQSLTNLIKTCSPDAANKIIQIYTPIDSSIMLDSVKSNSNSIREMLDFIGYTETSRSSVIGEFVKASTPPESIRDLVAPTGGNVAVLPPKSQVPSIQEQRRTLEPMEYNPDPSAQYTIRQGEETKTNNLREYDGGIQELVPIQSGNEETMAVYRPRIQKSTQQETQDTDIRNQPMYDPRGPAEGMEPSPLGKLEASGRTEYQPLGKDADPPRSLPPPMKTRESGGPAVAPVSYRPSV